VRRLGALVNNRVHATGRSVTTLRCCDAQLGMAGGGKDANASQFYITTGTALDSLDGKHTLFGEVSELVLRNAASA
jgi:cyclophilin family peptidyl-prolyl cis-trans isomerase